MLAACLHPGLPQDFSFFTFWPTWRQAVQGNHGVPWSAIASWVLWLTCQFFTRHVDLLSSKLSAQIPAWWSAFSSLESPGICHFTESGISIMRVSKSLNMKEKSLSFLKSRASIGCVHPVHCLQTGEEQASPRFMSGADKSQGAKREYCAGNVAQL